MTDTPPLTAVEARRLSDADLAVWLNPPILASLPPRVRQVLQDEDRRRRP